MLVKLLYSAVLAVVALAAAGELLRVWTDKRLYVGAFEYASSDADAESKGKAFGTQVALNHALIFRQLQDYNRRGAGGPSDTTFNIGPNQQLAVFQDHLDELALTYQNVNIGQFLASMRKALAQPNEVSGAVTKVDGRLWSKVSWPRAPTIDGKAEPWFVTEDSGDEAGAASQVACGVAWAQIAAVSKPIAAMGRANFCRWTYTLLQYTSLARAQAPADAAIVDRLRQGLRAMAKSGVVFPDIYRLRADLTDLLATEARSALLVEAQEDRLTYALLTDPALQKIPADARRLYAFALARPAIAIENGALTAVRDNWRAVLDPYAETIGKAAPAVGVLRRAGEAPRATAFRIGRTLIMTVDFALNDGVPPQGAEVAQDDNQRDARIRDLSFCDGDGAQFDGGACHPVRQIVVAASAGSFITVLRIDDSDEHETLALRDTAVPATALVDRYAYVLGYPTAGAPLVPNDLVTALLNDRPGIKRLMPGRTVAVRNGGGRSGEGTELVTDSDTLAGTAGAPVIDLVSGRVIAVHYGGKWDEKKGKFASAELITPELVEKVKVALASGPPSGSRP